MSDPTPTPYDDAEHGASLGDTPAGAGEAELSAADDWSHEAPADAAVQQEAATLDVAAEHREEGVRADGEVHPDEQARRDAVAAAGGDPDEPVEVAVDEWGRSMADTR